MKKFIIITTQRSGSTFFWRFLNQHPDLHVKGEMFLKSLNDSSSYVNFNSKSLMRRFNSYFGRSRNIQNYLDSFYSEVPAAKAAGFKVMYNQISEGFDDYLFNNDVSIIHLIRENILKIIVSAESARVRNLYHAEKETKIEKIKVRINTNNLLEIIQNKYAAVQSHKDRYKNLPYLETYYEKIVDNFDKEISKVFEFLGVSSCDGLDVPLKKINPDSLSEIIENYDDVVNKMKGTPFENFLI